MKTNKQQGFTLIELIIVIVILGILAVTASPKFLDLTGDARGSTVEGLEASLKGAVNIVYSKALVQGETSANGATTNPAVDVKFGYPDASEAAIRAILDLDLAVADYAGSSNTTEWEIAVGATGTPSTPTVRLYPNGDYDGTSALTGDSNCYVQYVEAYDSDSGAGVTVVAPVISKSITGC